VYERTYAKSRYESEESQSDSIPETVVPIVSYRRLKSFRAREKLLEVEKEKKRREIDFKANMSSANKTIQTPHRPSLIAHLPPL
jgi:hypothetical protein